MGDLRDALERARCPSCGEPLNDHQIDDAIVHERLVDNGYLHDDKNFVCESCGYGAEVGENWVHGCPIGDFDGGDDLRCECGAWRMVHRVVSTGKCKTSEGDTFRAPQGGVLLHTKCPACFSFWKIRRDRDPNGVSLIGYPQITGEVGDDTVPYGWKDSPPGIEGDD